MKEVPNQFESRLANFILLGATGSVLLFFYIPIFTLIAFSFQDGRYLTLPFDGISLRWFRELFVNEESLQSLVNSTLIALLTTVIATAIGTATALGIVRYRFRGLRVIQILALAPLCFPQLLLGIVLLLWFSVLGRWFGFNNSILTVLVGHVVYIAPFTTVVVAVQIFNFNASLEDAARDCGATAWEVYRFVTLPLIWPGMFSAAIFAFLLSWGNFYLTYSLSGTTRTLPTFVFSGIAIGSTPLYPAIATIAFIPGFVLVSLAWKFQTRK